MRILTLSAIGLMALLLAAACAGGDEESEEAFEFVVTESAPQGMMADAAMVKQVAVPGETVVVEREVVREVPVEVVKEVVREVEVVATELSKSAAAAGPPGSPSPADQGQQADLVSQRRIIVRTVDASLEVSDVAAAVEAVGEMAEEMGGWVVSSDRSRLHRGSVSVRVPAEDLDRAMDRLRGLAVKVNSEVASSVDVTDEFVDTTARLTNLKATESALLSLFERAGGVDELLKVQQELTRVQEEIERLQGRIKFLEQTAAYSLINVFLELSPLDMVVDAGAPMTVSVGELTRFRASFRPPEGIEDFSFTWDFGDGSQPVSGSRTAPALEEGVRFTATVNHVYGDDRDSPFIAEVEVVGTGDGGVAKGTRTVIVTVTQVPRIDVFAGESLDVEEGETVEFSGSFTRPEGLRDLSYEWDFGDGTPPAAGSLAAGVTNAAASHEYADHRPYPYEATLTVRAQSDAGEVESYDSIAVYVREDRGWVVGGWSVGDQGKTAVRSLSAVGLGVVTALVWALIFSPVWVAAIVVLVLVGRWLRRRALAHERESMAAGEPEGA